MSHDHREAIAALLDRHLSDRDFDQGCRLACGYDGDDRSTHLADALLGSDVLAQIRAEARAEALREAAAMFRDEGADAWGGDASWLTTGTRVANLAADWLDDRAEGSA